jgi:xanthine dehydrogenase accessory factor
MFASFRRLGENRNMTDLERILSLWRELEATGADYLLATVVAVEGPSYRKPGAHMLLTADGRRAGTVSGGCLEAEVASRAWWLTENGPTIRRYSTADDDGERPYGSGCGGVVYLLLERRATAHALLAALDQAFGDRVPLAVATVVEGSQTGRRAIAGLEALAREFDGIVLNARSSAEDGLQHLADRSLASHCSIETAAAVEGSRCKTWVHYRPARPALAIFGAGDDAQPLLELAKSLGWFVSVADGRSHLATRARFPGADEVCVLPIKDLSNFDSNAGLGLNGAQAISRSLRREDAVVVMTHSFEQDSTILACLLALECAPAYIGVLGPQRRTRELLGEAARLLGLPASSSSAQVDRWMAQLHAPTGLDLGAESPETIALSVLAEIQKFRTSATALPLRKVRAAAVSIAG